MEVSFLLGPSCRGGVAAPALAFPSGEGGAQRRKRSLPLYKIKRTVERPFLGGLHVNPHAPRCCLTARRQPQRGLPVWPMGQTADVGNRRLTNAAP